MSDDMGNLGEFRNFEEGVRMSLHNKADGISPNHRLGAILEAEAPAKRRTGYWLVGVAAAFVLVAALGIGYLLLPRTTASTASGAAAPAQNDKAGQRAEATPLAAPATAQASSTPTPAGGLWGMPVYATVTGTASQPWLLNPVSLLEPYTATSGDQATQQAVTTLVSGVAPDGQKLNPYGYQQPWKAGTSATVTVSDNLITIRLSQAGKSGLTSQQQKIAVQGLVWTATAASGMNVPVRVEVAGGGGAFASKPAGNYARPDSTTAYTDLVPIWVDSPLSGASVTVPVTVTGQACVFEAQFAWQLLQGSTVVTSSSAKASIACPDYGTYTISIGSLPSGTYTIRAYDVSAKDGSVAYETRVTFTVA